MAKLIQTIEKQARASNLSMEKLFNEVAEYISKNLKQCSVTNRVGNPIATLSSENFYYRYNQCQVTIINKL